MAGEMDISQHSLFHSFAAPFARHPGTFSAASRGRPSSNSGAKEALHSKMLESSFLHPLPKAAWPLRTTNKRLLQLRLRPREAWNRGRFDR